jgi:hypothetical protein
MPNFNIKLISLWEYRYNQIPNYKELEGTVEGRVSDLKGVT